MNIMDLGVLNPPIPSDSAFSVFKANLITDGTYTTELSALESCYQAIPYAFRDSDVFMLAGAYKLGQIAGYDSTGGIVDFGFSRNNIKNGFSGNYAPLEVANNIPLLDVVYYQNGVSGYVIESAKTTTLANTPMINQTLGCTGSVDGFMMNAVGNSGNNPTIFRQNYSSVGGLYDGNNYGLIIDVGNLPEEITFALHNTHIQRDQQFIINTSTRTLTTPSNVAILTQYTNIRFYWISSRLIRLSFRYANATPLNNGLIGYLIQRLIPNTENFGWGYFTDSSTRTPIKSTATLLGSSEADIIAPFNLTNSAKVCILTNKGINVIDAPSGIFDINPYITNSKLRLFTIKYN